jgi:hypothetical protein
MLRRTDVQGPATTPFWNVSPYRNRKKQRRPERFRNRNKEVGFAAPVPKPAMVSKDVDRAEKAGELDQAALTPCSEPMHLPVSAAGDGLPGKAPLCPLVWKILKILAE